MSETIRIHDHIELKSVTYGKKIVIFGAGNYGKNWCYDILRALEIRVYCFCDNNIKIGTIICDNVKVRSIEEICANVKDFIIFLAINVKKQSEVIEQLSKLGVDKIVLADTLFYQDMIQNAIQTDDIEIKEQLRYLIDDKEFLKNRFKKTLGIDLEINNPVTFNAKLQWLKLNDRNAYYTKLVDKYELKKIVEKKLGKDYVINTIGVWDKYDDICYDELPNQFVMKCTHDSGSVIVVKDKNSFDEVEAKKRMESYLKFNFYWMAREWPYKEVKPRIIVEEYKCEMDKGDLLDYKVFCFEGKAEFIQVDIDRFVDHKRNFYSRKWELMDMRLIYPNYKAKEISRPNALEEMLRISEVLSKGIHFLRVDFYICGSKIYVGECTFYPEAGMGRFIPEVWDEKLGGMLECN